MKHVKFKPWVGENYQVGFNGLRTLILGESHYQWDKELEIKDWSTITIDLVKDQMNGSETKAFWTKIATTLTGQTPATVDKEQFWNSVAFYNYVQESAGFGPRVRPSAKSWEISKVPFGEVLDDLKPNYIVVLGYRLWEMLPGDGFKGPEVENAQQTQTWIYQHRGGCALAYNIKHPSSGFSSQEWNKHILTALEKAKNLTVGQGNN